MNKRFPEIEQWIPYLVLIISLLGVVFIYQTYKAQNQELARGHFRQQSGEIKQAVLERFEKYETILEAGKALFAASETVSPLEWKNFAHSIDIKNRYPGMISFGYIKYVGENQKELFVKTAKENFPNFSIWPETRQSEYFPIYYIEPSEGNEKARGFDLASEARRSEAATRARDTGNAQITGKIQLIQNSDQDRPAFLMLTPIYFNNSSQKTLAERRQNIAGWIYGDFLVEDLMNGILLLQNSLIDVEIYEGSITDREHLLYDNDDHLDFAETHSKILFSEKIELKVADNLWTLYVMTRPQFSDLIASSKPLVFLGGGIALSLLLFALLRTLFNTQKRAFKLAQKMTEELDKSNTLKNAILNAANYSIISTQVDGTIQSFNREAERSLGYKSEEMVDKESPAIIHDKAEIEQRAQELSLELGRIIQPGFDVFTEKCKQGIPEEREWTYIRKDGTRFPVLLSVTAIRDDQGKIISYLGIASNISERKKIEKMKNEFISTVSHELRTPLTSIRGALGLITGGLAGDISDKAIPLVKIALSNCERLVRLINDILDIEKIESGKMQFHPQSLNIIDLVQQSIDANIEYANGYKVHLEFQKPKQSPILVYVDADRIVQVLTNLISNAVKFSPEGETVALSILVEDEIVRVQVKDKGAGIPEDFRKRIFSKFMQADASDTRQKGGTGLGLSISKSIVERSGGYIGFETETGKGSTFYFEFPTQIKIEHLQDMLQNMNILIVEDNPDIAQILKSQLQHSGCNVDIALSAQQAKEKLSSQSYDAMTLDIMLPDQDGLSLLQELRQDSRTSHLPILVVSAKASAIKNELNGNIANIIDWLDKPFDELRLSNAIDKIKQFHTGKALSILHIEDDPDTCSLIAKLLEGIAQIDQAHNLEEATQKIQNKRYHLIILDIGLPDGSGTEILNIPGKTSEGLIPVLVFSALEIDPITTRRVSSVLMKSKTSNEEFMQTVKRLLALYSKKK